MILAVDFLLYSIPLIVLTFPIIFAGVWFSVLFLLSRFGGWADMARKFRAVEIPEGLVLRWQSVQLGGWCNYNRVLTFVISEKGFYMAPWKPFSFGHQPLLIPWEEIRNSTPKKLLWIKQVVSEIGSPAIAKMCVERKVFEIFPKA